MANAQSASGRYKGRLAAAFVIVLLFAAGTADITVELPAGSDLRGKTGTLYAEGSFGSVDMTVSAGNLRVDEVERLDVKVTAGSVVARRVAGTADVKVTAGSVRIDEVAGDATIRATNGTTTVGEGPGALPVQGAPGDVAVSRVRGALTVKSAHAGIRVNDLVSGSATLATSFGSIEVGVPEGTAAYLDLSSENGAVHNQLTPTEGPVDDEATAEIHASSGYGDIVVRRP
jgi:DUF4097 and DUF4098 domain-containing protein YvlB